MADFPERIHALQPFWGTWYLDEKLGEGGFGKVYRIYREEFGTRYYAAMKWISLPASQSEIAAMRARGMNDSDIRHYLDGQVQELQSEINLMSSLRGSSHIVSYEDHAFIRRNDEIGWDILIRMELLTALPQKLAAGMTVGDVVRMGVDMCDALSLCAKMRIVHRDIKPDNIFINRMGDYKLGDFGVARRMQNEFTRMSMKGTPTYMAPEVFGGKTGDNSVDQYSLGLVMHRLLNAHQIPFAPAFDRVLTHEEREKAFSQRLNGTPIPAPLQGSDKLKAAICKACSFQAKKRFSSPDEFRKALEETLNDKECREPLLTMNAAKVSSKRSTLNNNRKKISLPMVIVGAGIVALIAVLAVIVMLALTPPPNSTPSPNPTPTENTEQPTSIIDENASTPEPWEGLAVVTEKNAMLYSSYLTQTMLHPLEEAEVVQVIGQQEENGQIWLSVQAGDEWGYVQDGVVQPMTDAEATAYYLGLASPEPAEKMTEVPTEGPTEELTATPTEDPTATPTAEVTTTPTEEPSATIIKEPTATPAGWGILREDLETLEATDNQFTVLGSTILRSSIHSVRFMNSLNDKPTGAWDVSANGDGSVWAWTVLYVSDPDAPYELIIASDGDVKLPENCFGFFLGYSHAVSIDFNGCVDISDVTNMWAMFRGCSSLTSLEFTSFEKINVTSMGRMFEGCSSLTSVDLSIFETTHVDNMRNMFYGCSSLTNVDVTSFDTTNVTDMGRMFEGCSSLTSLDIASFDTTNVTDMGRMFEGCSSLTSLDVTSFETDIVTDMRYLFGDCSSLTSLDLRSFNTSNAKRMDGMFSGCESLSSITVSKNFVIGDKANTEEMFTSCPITSPSGFTVYGSMEPTDTPTATPTEGPTLASTKEPVEWGILREAGWDSKVVWGSNISRDSIYSVSFRNSLDGKLENAWDVSEKRDGTVLAWVEQSGVTDSKGHMLYRLMIASEGGVKLPQNSEALFRDYHNMVSVDFANCVDTSNVINIRSMFSYCESLKELDMSMFDTSKVTNMRGMFYGCSSLKKLDISRFDTSMVTNMTGMFYGCSSLRVLDVSSFNTSGVIYMSSMFEGCSGLMSLDLTSFNTANAAQMDWLFSECSSLTSITVSSRFVISDKATKYKMFSNCPINSTSGFTVR